MTSTSITVSITFCSGFLVVCIMFHKTALCTTCFLHLLYLIHLPIRTKHTIIINASFSMWEALVTRCLRFASRSKKLKNHCCKAMAINLRSPASGRLRVIIFDPSKFHKYKLASSAEISWTWHFLRQICDSKTGPQHHFVRFPKTLVLIPPIYGEKCSFWGGSSPQSPATEYWYLYAVARKYLRLFKYWV